MIYKTLHIKLYAFCTKQHPGLMLVLRNGKQILLHKCHPSFTLVKNLVTNHERGKKKNQHTLFFGILNMSNSFIDLKQKNNNIADSYNLIVFGFSLMVI
jgi:hypothetical protein